MLFEFSIARKYLVPKKRQLSMSLIALMSVGVISLVVWLVLVFLSVTDGIEKNWLKKLTSLNAPIRITPTHSYYSSYYYQVDGISNASNYTHQSIGEKSCALLTDPYAADEDPEIPDYWGDKVLNDDGSVKDLVKLAFSSIEQVKNNMVAQDYEIAGAMLKLRMVRPHGSLFTSAQEKSQGHLTQVSYISSFCGKSPYLHSLIEPPRIEDLNHLFFLANLSSSGTTLEVPEGVKRASVSEFQQRLESLLFSITIKRLKNTSHKWQALFELLPEGVAFDVHGIKKNGQIAYLSFPLKKGHSQVKGASMTPGTVIRKNQKLLFTSKEGKTLELGRGTPLFVEEPLSMEASWIPAEWKTLASLRDVCFDVTTTLQGQVLQGSVPWEGIEIEEADAQMIFDKPPTVAPSWPYLIQEEGKPAYAVLPQMATHEVGVVLPKNFQTSGVKIGDMGYFSYGAATTSSVQEQRMQLVVTGFYDPGVMAIGAKAILTSSNIVHDINTSSQSFSFDQNMVNGIQVWFDDLSQTQEIHTKLTEAFDKAGILPYWTITPYYEYEFAKDLLLQFQSDKYLFTLIGVIVLVVACCNIISLLVILVNDKRREIAILRAMGAPKKSIALIFTLCGGIMGTLSTLIGTLAAVLTLHNIDVVVSFLSFLQGHDAFNAIFYGKSLPNELSHHALVFILIATPVISLLAGLVPALKACKFHPSEVLRSEG